LNPKPPEYETGVLPNQQRRSIIVVIVTMQKLKEILFPYTIQQYVKQITENISLRKKQNQFDVEVLHNAQAEIREDVHMEIPRNE
jgi:hypothetical protein